MLVWFQTQILILCNGIFVHNQQLLVECLSTCIELCFIMAMQQTAAGTLLVNDGSHVTHKHFFVTISIFSPEEKLCFEIVMKQMLQALYW